MLSTSNEQKVVSLPNSVPAELVMRYQANPINDPSITPILNPLEAIIEFARHSDDRARERFCQLCVDLNQGSESANNAETTLRNLFQSEQKQFLSVNLAELVSQMTSSSSELIQTVTEVALGSNRAGGESGRAASARPSEQLSDFLMRNILIPLVDQSISQFRGQRDGARLPCIMTLGVKRADQLQMLGKHANQVIVCDSRQYLIKKASGSVSFLSVSLPWNFSETFNENPRVIVLGDSFCSAADTNRAMQWISEQVSEGATVIAAVQSGRPIAASPAAIRRALGDEETNMSLLALEDLLLGNGIQSSREEHTLALKAKTAQEMGFLRSLIEGSLSQEARINQELIGFYVDHWCSKGMEFNYPVDLLVASGPKLAETRDPTDLLPIFQKYERETLLAAARYLKSTIDRLPDLRPLESRDLKRLFITGLLGSSCSNNSQPRIKEQELKARIVLSQWMRKKKAPPDMFSFMVKLSHIHELLPMIFREVVLWQGKVEAISAKYKIPACLLNALNRQLKDVLTPAFAQVPWIHEEYHGPLKADALIRRWLLTRPSADYEEPVPPCLGLINGEELPEDLNAAFKATHIFGHQQQVNKSQTESSQQVPYQADVGGYQTSEGSGCYNTSGVGLYNQFQIGLKRFYDRYVTRRSFLMSQERGQLLAAIKTGTTLSQGNLAILEAKSIPSDPQFDLKKYRVLSSEQEQYLFKQLIRVRQAVQQELLLIPELQLAALKIITSRLRDRGLGRVLIIPPKKSLDEYKKILAPQVTEMLTQISRLDGRDSIEAAKGEAVNGMMLFNSLHFESGLRNELIRRLILAIDREHTSSNPRESDLRSALERIAKWEARRLFYRSVLQEHNLRLVASWAVKFNNRGHSLSFDDFFQQGQIGVARAIDKYSLEGGSNFSTYASFWIQQVIIRAIREQDAPIRLPGNRHDTLRRIYRAKQELAKKPGAERPPSAEDIAKISNVPVADISLLTQVTNYPASLDQQLGSDGDLNLGVVVSSQQDIEAMADARLAIDRIAQTWRLLSPSQQAVLNLRYGYGFVRVRGFNAPPQLVSSEAALGITVTFDRLSSVLQITSQRVNQIEKIAESRTALLAKTIQEVNRQARAHLGDLVSEDPRLLWLVSELSLEDRVINFLFDNHYFIVSQCLGATPSDLISMPKSGPVMLNKILFALERIGFLWRDDRWVDTSAL